MCRVARCEKVFSDASVQSLLGSQMKQMQYRPLLVFQVWVRRGGVASGLAVQVLASGLLLPVDYCSQ
jgi:hypothetical protein